MAGRQAICPGMQVITYDVWVPRKDGNMCKTRVFGDLVTKDLLSGRLYHILADFGSESDLYLKGSLTSNHIWSMRDKGWV
jgi:hypothetical protein